MKREKSLVEKIIERDLQDAQATIDALTKEREDCICPCDMQSPFCPVHGINGTSRREQTAWR